MIKTIYANGCSFAAGTELEIECSLPSHKHASRFDPESPLRRYQAAHAWPAQLAARLGADQVVNEALGGGSNTRMIRRTIAFVGQFLAGGGRGPELLICLGFTDVNRHERFVIEARRGTGSEDGWELLKPTLSRRRHGTGRESLAANRAYYGTIYSDRQAVTDYAQQLVLMQSLCERYNILHYFHDAMEVNDAPLAREARSVPALELVNPAIHRSFIGVPTVRHLAGFSFKLWAQQAGVDIGPGGHPLREGHQGWADVLIADMDKRGLLR